MTQVIYKTLIDKIKETLESVDNLKAVFSYQTTKFNNVYPVAIFYPTAIENEYNSNAEDSRVYSFDLFVIAGGDTTMDNLFSTVLPNTVDAVLEEFGKEWDINSIDGHRVWLRIDSGAWGSAVEQSGKEAWAQFNILIKLNTNIN